MILPPIERVSRERELPLSFVQESEIERLFPANQNAASPISNCFRLKGTLNHEALQQSLNVLVERHEVLRTTFPLINGRPVQVIASAMTVQLPVVNIQNLPEPERMPEVQRIISQEVYRPYDLTHETAWRALLLKLDQDDHVLLLTMEHFIADWWSMELMVRDTMLLYRTSLMRLRSPLPEPPIQYADFAYWQRRTFGDESEVLQKSVSYWAQRLEGMGLKPELHLPDEIPLPLVRGEQECAVQLSEISAALTESLKKLSQQNGTTMSVLVLAALVALLHRYTRKDDIGVCSYAVGRHLPGTEEVMGWFSNMLVFRFNLSGVVTFSELIRRVQTAVVEAYEYQDLPFVVLHQKYSGTTTDEHPPYVSFNLDPAVKKATSQNPNRPPNAARSSELAITFVKIPRPSGPMTKEPGIHVDLGWTSNGGLNASVFYEVQRYPASLIAQLLTNFRSLLEEISAHPEKRLSDLLLVIKL